jgi:hypothetical protein
LKKQQSVFFNKQLMAKLRLEMQPNHAERAFTKPLSARGVRTGGGGNEAVTYFSP